ncbi:hypothetical protein GOBAR_AA10063 [Gossypium barbadense]|uniref:Uncharacterized protein n=1 Tax=Gossypium barbadense TaxID=3634 RepID=A0A2P5Y4S6_GOSBA|nr:hypothetical protein GOBAR_AA10063 [Gossypium barbadense]
MSHGRVCLCSLLPRPCIKDHACVILAGSPTVRPQPCRMAVAIYRSPCWGKSLPCFHTVLSTPVFLAMCAFESLRSMSRLKSTWQAVQSEFRALGSMLVNF